MLARASFIPTVRENSMKKTFTPLRAGLAAACLLVAAGSAAVAGTGTPAAAPAFTLKDTFTGSIIALDVASAAIPFDKTWAELTSQQKDVVRSDYESLAPEDEPPFPLHGLKRIVLPIAKRADSMGDFGKLIASVTIDGEGNPHDVVVYKSPSKELTALTAANLIDTKFKPAMCKGQPCTMAFVLRIELLEPPAQARMSAATKSY
jgi:hypothetical protein